MEVPVRSSEPVLNVNAVRHAMVDKDFNQVKLAAAVGVHQSRVSLWLQGENNPDLPSARNLARALGVTLDSLLVD